MLVLNGQFPSWSLWISWKSSFRMLSRSSDRLDSAWNEETIYCQVIPYLYPLSGKAGRSISLVAEDDRKILKEIVKSNADRAMKQRLVAPGMV